jgi:hypothetical protein
MIETFFKVLHQLVSIQNFRIERHVNRENERIPRRLRRGSSICQVGVKVL